MEKELNVKLRQCGCGSKEADDSINKHCKNGHCKCRAKGEPCLPEYCGCRNCKNTAKTEEWTIPPQHKPVERVLEDKTVVKVHPALVLFKRNARFTHLQGTTDHDNKLRKQLNKIDYKAASCPQCSRLESTFLTWHAAHVVDLATGHYYLIRTCNACNTGHAAGFLLRRNTFGLLICAHDAKGVKGCKCDNRYTSKISEFIEENNSENTE
jgi:hypothetical protein